MSERTLKTASGESFVADDSAPRAMHRATVILAPGMMQGRNQPLFTMCVEALSNAGFVTVAFDWAESTAGKLPSPELRVEREHLEAAIAHGRSLSKGLKTFVVGKSLGGLAALEHQASQKSGLDGIVLLTFPVHEPGRPEARVSYARRLITTELPVLVITGDADEVCDLKALASLVAPIPKPPPQVIIPGGHKVDSEPARRLAVEATVCWLKRWAGAQG